MKLVVAGAFVGGLLTGLVLLSNDKSQEWRLQHLEARELDAVAERVQQEELLTHLRSAQSELSARIAQLESVLGQPHVAEAAMLRLPVTHEIKQAAEKSSAPILVGNGTTNNTSASPLSAAANQTLLAPGNQTALDSKGDMEKATLPVPAQSGLTKTAPEKPAPDKAQMKGKKEKPQSSSQKSAPVKKKDEVHESPEKLYAHALALFEKRQYGQARELLQDYLSKYPKHSLVPNAYYWTGESLFAQQKFQEAVIAFQHVIQTYPAHHKTPDALLMLIHSKLRLGDIAGARTELATLTRRFPGSRAARMGEEALGKNHAAKDAGQLRE